MSALIFRFVPDGYDQVGQLWLDVEDPPFSGSGFYWSDLTELSVFLDKLQAYPLAERITESWGSDDANGQNVLSLSFEPSGPRGGISVSVFIADLYDGERRVSAKLRTDYASLDALLTELRVLVQRREGSASLECS